MKRIKSIPALPPRCAPYGDGARASARFTVPKQATRKTFRPRKCLIFREFPAVFKGFPLFSTIPAACVGRVSPPGVLASLPKRGNRDCRILAFGNFSEPCGAVGWTETGQAKPFPNLRKCLIFRGFPAVFGGFRLFSANPSRARRIKQDVPPTGRRRHLCGDELSPPRDPKPGCGLKLLADGFVTTPSFSVIYLQTTSL